MKKLFIILVLCLTIMGIKATYAQVKDYKATPDFSYQDYEQTLKYEIQPYSLMGQTLYLENVSDTLLEYFFTGKRATMTKNELKNAKASGSLKGKDANVEYYKLTRMSKDQLYRLKGSWFRVEDYVADQFAFSRISNANPAKQLWNKMTRGYLKLLVGDSGDTVFYAYSAFYNQFHFPFTPISYFNYNKNGYPNSKYSYDDLSLIKYDTNSNYALIPEKLIGEKLTLPVVTDATLERLYNGIRLYNYPDDDRKYTFTEYPINKAKRLEGQTFIVKDVAFDSKNLTNVYLKLVIEGRADTIYYKYPTKLERHLFGFVVDSFLEKIRKTYKNREFTVRGDKYPLTVIDIRRKRPLTLHQGDIFKCLDIVVKDGKFQMLMRNELGRKFYMPEDYALGDWLSFDMYLMDSRVEKYRTTFPTAYKAICNKELVSNMSMDMTSLSWGKYNREVFTNFDGSDRHWFYMGNVYIIFKNNVLHRVAIIPKELR